MPKEAIFIPGLLCSGDLFGPQREGLSDLLEMAIGDHRRHATLGETAQDILSGAPERFVLAGLSMGGYISFEIMRRAGERVQALVLMDTTARPDTPEQSRFRRELIATARSEGLEPVIDMLLPKFLAPENARKPEVAGLVRRMARETGVEAFCRQQEMIMARPDARAALGEIACPTLVIVGAQDALTPPELAEEIAGHIAGARLEVIPDAGHLATIENPAGVTAAIRSFLEAVSGR